jgi:hypothetical protein
MARVGVVDRIWPGGFPVFADPTDYLDKKRSYSGVFDDWGEPIEDIEDKETYHLLDAERYVIGRLNHTGEVGPSGPARSVPRVEVHRPGTSQDRRRVPVCRRR